MSSNQQSFRLITSAGTTVAGAVLMAETPWQRFVGLMGKRELAAYAGLCLRPCSSIHMFFMRISVDAVFLDKDGVAVRIYPSLRPWRVTRVVRKAKSCIELPAGRLAAVGVNVGDQLTLAA